MILKIEILSVNEYMIMKIKYIITHHESETLDTGWF